MLILLYVRHLMLAVDISIQMFVSIGQQHKGQFARHDNSMVLYPNMQYYTVICIDLNKQIKYDMNIDKHARFDC
jgi:hypothetical protein